MKKTAKEVYEKAGTDCRNLMTMIEEILEQRAQEDTKGGINWGHVGNIQHTKSQLIETLASYLYTPEESEEEVREAIESKLKKMQK